MIILMPRENNLGIIFRLSLSGIGSGVKRVNKSRTSEENRKAWRARSPVFIIIKVSFSCNQMHQRRCVQVKPGVCRYIALWGP